MEHVVQFAFSLDDRVIQKRLEDEAFKTVCDDLKYDLIKSLPKRHSYIRGMSQTEKVDWRSVTEKMIKDILNENKDAIIEAAGKEMAEVFKRSKDYRELKKEVINDKR